MRRRFSRLAGKEVDRDPNSVTIGQDSIMALLSGSDEIRAVDIAAYLEVSDADERSSPT